MTPRRFEVHPVAHDVPADVLAWAQAKADAHEAEWGFDEDVGIDWPLCGWRGSVGRHIDVDMGGGSAIIGLVLEGSPMLVGAFGTDDVLPLAPGTLYVLDPMVQHGTIARHGDERLLFLTDSVPINDTTPPAELAARLIAKARKTMELEARRPDPFHGMESVRDR